MKGLILASGTEPIVEDFNISLSELTQEAIKERLTDYVNDGIVHSELGPTNEFAMTPNIVDGTKIDVSFGTAYSSGERIIIDTNIPYDPTNPSKTDPSSGKPTPQSTGNLAVSLANYTLNTLNYVWIQYLQTIDISQIAIHPITSEKFFTRQTDGYQIIVDTTHDPLFNPLANSIFVGTVRAAGPSIVIPPTSILLANRTFALLHFNTVKIKTPRSDHSDATAVYGSSEVHTVDEHVKAVGTGVVSPANPHGMSFADLGSGGAGAEPLNELFQKETHDNKIRINSITEITGGLHTQVIVVDPGNDYVIVSNLGVNEAVYVNGKRKTVGDIAAGADPVTVSFAGHVTNLYFGYLDNNGAINITSDFATDVYANNYLPIFAVQWNQFDPSGGGGDIRNPDNSALRTIKDLRTFIGENNTEIRFFDPQSVELFPGRRWLNITDGQFKAVKDLSGTIVITG